MIRRFIVPLLLSLAFILPLSGGEESATPTGESASTPTPPPTPPPTPAPIPDPQSVFSGVTRIVAIGDVHGDLDAFRDVLELAGLLDAGGHWSGGKTHLVQTGDILDRGDDGRAIMDLLMRLQVEARKTQGAVHCLLGNHEVMNMLGDLRYVTEPDLAAYADLSPIPDPPEAPRGRLGHDIAFAETGRYGRWLRGLPAVIKVNDTLFVHGGLGPIVRGKTLDQINKWVREPLFAGDPAAALHAPGLGPTGPLWFRGYALDKESQWLPKLRDILYAYKARRMVMGHTTTDDGRIRLRFRGRAVFIDTGLSRGYGRHVAALEIRGRTLYAIYPDRKEKLFPPRKAVKPIRAHR